MGARRFLVITLIGIALTARGPDALAQGLYKVITPDGRTYVTTTPPPATGGTRVELMPGTMRAPPGMPAALPPMPRAGGGMVPQIAPAPITLRAGLASDEMRALRACTSARHAELELRKAAEEVMRTVASVRPTDDEATARYRRGLLDAQWRNYQSLGGTAAAPAAVTLPPDPCAAEQQAMQAKSASLEADYQRCAAEHPKEMRLSKLSYELAGAGGYLRTVESAAGVLRRGADAIAGRDPGGKGDPKQIRAILDDKFREYRALGGPATRLEDVKEIPDPCLPKVEATASTSAAIRQSRTLPLPAR